MELFILIIITILLYYEFIYLNQKQPPIITKPTVWTTKLKSSSLILKGSIIFSNPHKRMEIMIPELDVKAKIYIPLEGSKAKV